VHAFHRRHWGTGRGSNNGKARRRLRYGVTMRHPHLVVFFQALMQHTTGVGNFGTAVFTVAGLRNAAATSVVHRLEAVANTKDRNTLLQQLGLQLRRTVGINRRWATGENQSRRVFGLDLFNAGRMWNYLGVNRRLTYATSNQLCVLGAKIHHEDWARSC